jgi:hypothetical protein
MDELNRFNTAEMEDMGAFYDARGKDPHLLDTETRIEEGIHVLEEWREYYTGYRATVRRMENEGSNAEETKAARSDLFMCEVVGRILRSSLEDLARDTDVKYKMEEEESCNMYTYIEMYIDRFTIGELAVIMDILEDMHASKTISWYYYVQCGLAVCYRLHSICPKGRWGATLANLRKHNQVNHTKVASYEDRFYGEMSFSMESAIDLMDQARTIASRCNQDLEDTFYSILEAQDIEDHTWTPTLNTELY